MSKNKRGPKEKPEAEKKQAIRIWVKKKYHAKASKEAKALERKYDTIEGNSAVRA